MSRGPPLNHPPPHAPRYSNMDPPVDSHEGGQTAILVGRRRRWRSHPACRGRRLDQPRRANPIAVVTVATTVCVFFSLSCACERLGGDDSGRCERFYALPPPLGRPHGPLNGEGTTPDAVDGHYPKILLQREAPARRAWCRLSGHVSVEHEEHDLDPRNAQRTRQPPSRRVPGLPLAGLQHGYMGLGQFRCSG